MEIRLLERTDIPFFNKVRNDSVCFLHNQTKYSLDDNYSWFDSLDDPYFILEMNNEPIGYFRTSNWENNEPYIGLDIQIDSRGNGYAKLAYGIFLNTLRDTYNITIVHLEVLEVNERAKHIYDKLGFIVTDVQPFGDTNSIKMTMKL